MYDTLSCSPAPESPTTAPAPAPRRDAAPFFFVLPPRGGAGAGVTSCGAAAFASVKHERPVKSQREGLILFAVSWLPGLVGERRSGWMPAGAAASHRTRR